MTTLNLTRLSGTLGVAFNGSDGCIIYDTRAREPVAKLVLEATEMIALATFWHDGYCAGCGTGIPQHHSLCQNCLTEEMHTWGR